MWKHFDIQRAIILSLLTCLIIALITRLNEWYALGAFLGAFIGGCLRAYEKYRNEKKNVKDENNNV